MRTFEKILNHAVTGPAGKELAVLTTDAGEIFLNATTNFAVWTDTGEVLKGAALRHLLDKVDAYAENALKEMLGVVEPDSALNLQEVTEMRLKDGQRTIVTNVGDVILGWDGTVTHEGKPLSLLEMRRLNELNVAFMESKQGKPAF